jgi:hypothetical protein
MRGAQIQQKKFFSINFTGNILRILIIMELAISILFYPTRLHVHVCMTTTVVPRKAK